MRSVLRPITLLLTSSVLLLQAAQAGDRTYRWTDEKGRVHYSDVKNDKGERVEVKPGSGVSVTSKDSPATIATRQLDCQRKTDKVTIYNNSSQINETDGLGNTKTYSDEERQQLINRAQELAQTACSQPGVVAPVANENEQKS